MVNILHILGLLKLSKSIAPSASNEKNPWFGAILLDIALEDPIFSLQIGEHFFKPVLPSTHSSSAKFFDVLDEQCFFNTLVLTSHSASAKFLTKFVIYYNS